MQSAPDGIRALEESCFAFKPACRNQNRTLHCPRVGSTHSASCSHCNRVDLSRDVEYDHERRQTVNYLPLLLFLPALLLIWAAFVSKQPETKHNFVKSAVVYLCGIVLFVPVYFWKELAKWLFHSN